MPTLRLKKDLKKLGDSGERNETLKLQLLFRSTTTTKSKSDLITKNVYLFLSSDEENILLHSPRLEKQDP